jgi:hypothetical protein
MNERETAKKIMEILTSQNGKFKNKFHQHGKGRNPPKRGKPEYDFFLRLIEEKIRRQEPIEFIIGFAAHKNLNACKSPLPDNSEFFSLNFLASTARNIEDIYPKGIIINIIQFDARAMLANGVLNKNIEQYFAGLNRMIAENTDFSKCFRLHKLSTIWNSHGENFSRFLEEKIEETRKNIESDPSLPELIVRAKRNNKNSVSAKDLLIKEAVVKFKASFIAERDFGIWDKHFPGAILLSFRANPYYGKPYLLPWTTGKGSITQPWHGYYDKITGQVISQERQQLQKLAFRWF